MRGPPEHLLLDLQVRSQAFGYGQESLRAGIPGMPAALPRRKPAARKPAAKKTAKKRATTKRKSPRKKSDDA